MAGGSRNGKSPSIPPEPEREDRSRLLAVILSERLWGTYVNKSDFRFDNSSP